MAPRRRWLLLGLALGGCGRGDRTSFAPAAPADEPAGAPNPGTFGAPGSCAPCDDFPAAPLFADGATADDARAFAGPEGDGGPCLSEPASGALVPSNWLRPRFRWIAPRAQTVFELRVHADVERHDLVVYTRGSSWTMPKAMWSSLAASAAGHALAITVRGSDGRLVARGAGASMTVAPVEARGSMVYWATTAFDQDAQSTRLAGFRIGDESVREALATRDVKQKVRATWGASLSEPTTQVQCIGCHTATPDGKYAAFNAQWPWPIALASVEQGKVGAVPEFLTPGARSALSPNAQGAYAPPDVQRAMLGIQTYSKAHWRPGDRIAVTTRGSAWYRARTGDPGAPTGVVSELVWIDLEAPSDARGVAWDVLRRDGDTRSAAAPSFRHDGARIAYASTDTGAEDGRMGKGASDLFVVPFGDRAGGAATRLPGASEPGFEEYYPAYSADDALVAFNRVRAGLSMYDQPEAEVFVVPAEGGTPVRLAANDPVACTGKKSPGVKNTWPKWSPAAARGPDGRTYHWLVFSSTRDGSFAQLYVSAVVRETSGAISTFPAVYLWNQDPASHNLVPAWDVFELPPSDLR